MMNMRLELIRLDSELTALRLSFAGQVSEQTERRLTTVTDHVDRLIEAEERKL